MRWNKNDDDPRRRLLIKALAAGLFSNAVCSREASARLLGARPAAMPPGKSIYRIEGEVLINGQPATLDTQIAASATIETGQNSEVVYVVGESAFLQRSESHVTLETREADSMIVSATQLLTGKILSVFPSGRPVRMTTRNASIGLRGTGVYMEWIQAGYFCTCCRTTDIVAVNDPTSRETVVSRQHDRPLYILAAEQPGQNIRAAPFINHTDQELMLIEALMGRTPPFVFEEQLHATATPVLSPLRAFRESAPLSADEEDIVFRALRLSGCIRGQAYAKAPAMEACGSGQERTGSDLGEVDAALYLGVEPGVVRRSAGDAIAIAVVIGEINRRLKRAGGTMAALACVPILQYRLDVGETDGARRRSQRIVHHQYQRLRRALGRVVADDETEHVRPIARSTERRSRSVGVHQRGGGRPVRDRQVDQRLRCSRTGCRLRMVRVAPCGLSIPAEISDRTAGP